MSNSQVQAIEQNIKALKKVSAVGEAVERLMNNRDFKLVVLEEYFKAESIRLVHLKADPNFQTAERKVFIEKQMDSIGFFSQFLQTLTFKAQQAEKAIIADEKTIEEIAAEGDE